MPSHPYRHGLLVVLVAGLNLTVAGCGGEPETGPAVPAAPPTSGTTATRTVPAPTQDDPVQDWELRYLPAIDQHLEAGRLDSVIHLCQEGLEADSTRIVLYNLLASAYAAQARYDEATQALKTAVRLSPGFVAGWVNLGGLHTRRGQLQEAVPFLEEAARLDSDAPESHRRLGEVYLFTGRHNDAAGELRTALDLMPHDATLNRLLGDALTALERDKEALEAYLRAGTLDPGFVDAHQRAAELATALGRSALADSLRAVDARLQEIAGGAADALDTRQQLRTAIQNAPEDAIHHARLGGFYLYHGYLTEALALFERAARQEPDNAWLLHEFGGLLSQKGHGEEALHYYRHALEIEPDYQAALVNAGGVLNAMQRHQEALPYLQKAVELAPDDAMSHFYLGVTQMSLGRRDEARRLLVETRGLLGHTEGDAALAEQVEAAIAALADDGSG